MSFALGRPATAAFEGGLYSTRKDADHGSVTSRRAMEVLFPSGAELTTNHFGSVNSILDRWIWPGFKTSTWVGVGTGVIRPSPIQRYFDSCQRSSGTRRNDAASGRSITAT